MSDLAVIHHNMKDSLAHLPRYMIDGIPVDAVCVVAGQLTTAVPLTFMTEAPCLYGYPPMPDGALDKSVDARSDFGTWRFEALCLTELGLNGITRDHDLLERVGADGRSVWCYQTTQWVRASLMEGYDPTNPITTPDAFRTALQNTNNQSLRLMRLDNTNILFLPKAAFEALRLTKQGDIHSASSNRHALIKLGESLVGATTTTAVLEFVPRLGSKAMRVAPPPSLKPSVDARRLINACGWKVPRVQTVKTFPYALKKGAPLPFNPFNPTAEGKATYDPHDVSHNVLQATGLGAVVVAEVVKIVKRAQACIASRLGANGDEAMSIQDPSLVALTHDLLNLWHESMFYKANPALMGLSLNDTIAMMCAAKVRGTPHASDSQWPSAMHAFEIDGRLRVDAKGYQTRAPAAHRGGRKGRPLGGRNRVVLGTDDIRPLWIKKNPTLVRATEESLVLRSGVAGVTDSTSEADKNLIIPRPSITEMPPRALELTPTPQPMPAPVRVLEPEPVAKHTESIPTFDNPLPTPTQHTPPASVQSPYLSVPTYLPEPPPQPSRPDRIHYPNASEYTRAADIEAWERYDASGHVAPSGWTWAGQGLYPPVEPDGYQPLGWMEGDYKLPVRWADNEMFPERDYAELNRAKHDMYLAYPIVFGNTPEAEATRLDILARDYASLTGMERKVYSMCNNIDQYMENGEAIDRMML
jgi:hypothetical protein